MKKLLLLAAICIGFAGIATAQTHKKKTKKKSKTVLSNVVSTVAAATGIPAVAAVSTGLSNNDIVEGLKEALSIGSQKSSDKASAIDGFFKNPLIKIPFPEQAKIIEIGIRKIGMGSQVDQFVLTLNRTAENASKEAVGIFLSSIKGISIEDGLQLLKGGDNAATEFLKTKTTDELKAKFLPIVQQALNKVEITKYWNPIITKYNAIPFTKQQQQPDLNQYVTDKALAGLFQLVAQEEKDIRTNPAARVSSILQKVFGS